jgi:leucyl aminopeptidase
MPDQSPDSPAFAGTTALPASVQADLLFIPVFERDDRLNDVAGVDAATGGDWAQATSSGEFKAKLYELFVTRVTGGYAARRLAFIGAGSRADLDAERMRRVAAAASYAARRCGASSVALLLRGGLRADIVADGLSAAEFDSGTYKSSDRPGASPDRYDIVDPTAAADALAAAVERGRIVGHAANFARALANEPGNVLTPGEFANRVRSNATAAGLSVEVLEPGRLHALGMRLLLGVAQGSAEPARLIVIRHDPPGAPDTPVLGFVGKGVTFDSGGISIKPADGMDRMKDDMAGGAAVAAALGALARLRCPYRVLGVIPTVENMPGGRAMRPGDVIVGASGTSVEIINTDAEGRLILADALWYAGKQGATHLVDVATLTGACLVALGRTVSGLFGRPDDWVDTVRAAAIRAGDRVWPLPIYEEAREQLRSEIADLVNSAGRPGGASTAAAFLQEFAGNRPWAHLDIAGTAWSEIKRAYQPKGATGAAVRLLTELAMTAGGLGTRTD